jgi:hypothetical protein
MSALLSTISHAMARVDAMPDSVTLVVLGLLFLALCAIANQRNRSKN